MKTKGRLFWYLPGTFAYNIYKTMGRGKIIKVVVAVGMELLRDLIFISGIYDVMWIGPQFYEILPIILYPWLTESWYQLAKERKKRT